MDPEQLGQLPLQMTAPPRVASQEYIKPPKTSMFTESVPSASSFCVVKILSEISNKYEVERQLKFELMHETINSKTSACHPSQWIKSGKVVLPFVNLPATITACQCLQNAKNTYR